MSNQTKVFYDGDCPLCKREIAIIKNLIDDKKIDFLDIGSKDFIFEHYKKSYKELMTEIHALQPNGQWVVGMDVFRIIYASTKFRKLVVVSRLPLVKQLLNLSYKVFAKYRLRLTGRACNLENRNCKIKDFQ